MKTVRIRAAVAVDPETGYYVVVGTDYYETDDKCEQRARLELGLVDGAQVTFITAEIPIREPETVEAAVRRAGLDGIIMPDGEVTRLRIKDLRGVFATYYLRSGGSPRELQQILGHSRIETTLRYVKTLPVEEADNMAETEKRQGLALLGIERAG